LKYRRSPPDDHGARLITVEMSPFMKALRSDRRTAHLVDDLEALIVAVMLALASTISTSLSSADSSSS